MRLLRRNLKPFWYATYKGLEDGEPTYNDPVMTKGNISRGAGQAVSETFGILPKYDSIIVLDDTLTPIDEASVIWIDNDPTDGKPYDYIVVRGGVAKSLNFVALAVAKVVVG